MARVKVFQGYSEDVEAEINQWIAEAERRGARVIQIATSSWDSGPSKYHALWVLYEGLDRKVDSTR